MPKARTNSHDSAGAGPRTRAPSGQRRGRRAGDHAAPFDHSPQEFEGIDRRRWDDMLRESEARFRAVWESAADGMVLSDPQGIVIAANPAYCRLYGYAAEEVVGHSFAVIFPEQQRDWAVELYRSAFADPEIGPSVESMIMRKDGSERIVDSRYTFITQDGGRTAMLSIVRDITQRREVEEERAPLLIREHRARERAEQAVRARDELLSIVSHDLKNPLATIFGFAQVLRRRLARIRGSIGEAAPSQGSEHLEEVKSLVDGLSQVAGQIEEAAKRMTAIIDDLLDTARLQAGGNQSAAYGPVDLVEIAERVARTEQQSTPDHEVRVVASVPSLVGQWDAGQLERALTNLLSNAIKYSPDGGEITVDVMREEAHDQEAASGTGAWAVLRVRDQGIGIPAQDLPRIFDWYHRGSNVKKRIGGTGIGLASVREIIEQHDGTVGVTSEEGTGSTFTVRLPLISPAASELGR